MWMDQLKYRARENWKQHKEIIADTQAYFRSNPTLLAKVKTKDANFVRKLYDYPGDLTTCRIEKIFEWLQQNKK